MKCSVLHISLILVAILCCGSTAASAPLEPDSGVLAGVNLDFDEYSPAEFNARMHFDHSCVVVFSAWGENYPAIENKVALISPTRAALVLTPEPWVDLDTIDDDDIAVFTNYLAKFITVYDTPVLVRFGHEMNGSWYPWSAQPVKYSSAFARVAQAVHALGPSAGMVWAPNAFEGYPFEYTGMDLAAYLATSRPHGTAADFALMDSNNNNVLDGDDDPYGPYYPGDEHVDWVGITIYHWANNYPWTQNEIPYNRKLTFILSGKGNALHNFYQRFAADKNKPLMLPETSALFVDTWGGASEYDLKSRWLDQLYHAGPSTPQAQSLPDEFPLIKGVGWFDIRKYEDGIGTTADWRISHRDDLRTNYWFQVHQTVDDIPYFKSSAAFRGYVYGWNGWNNDWRALDPGCSLFLSSTAWEGGSSLQLSYDGSGSKQSPNVALKEYANLDADWWAHTVITAHARVPAGGQDTPVSIILQSNITGWDPLQVYTVPADGQWHKLAWHYTPVTHLGAEWLNLYFSFDVSSGSSASLLVDQLALDVPEPGLLAIFLPLAILYCSRDFRSRNIRNRGLRPPKNVAAISDRGNGIVLPIIVIAIPDRQKYRS